MSRRLDIGIASYGASVKLARTLTSLRDTAHGDWRCFLIDNPGPDPATRDTIAEFAREDSRFVPVLLDANIGYAGAVCQLFKVAESEHIAYSDNDVIFCTPGWDGILRSYLDRFEELGLVFPNTGAAPIERGGYTEVMWAVGFCWVLRRACMAETGPFDTTLGHQEEADYCLRVRMGGWKCAAVREVEVQHDATATNDPASNERITRGVINFVNKWSRYFGGKNLSYHSPKPLRWEDWPPNALHMEEYWLTKYPDLNATPEVVRDGNFDYDLIRVPRRAEYYRGRII